MKKDIDLTDIVGLEEGAKIILSTPAQLRDAARRGRAPCFRIAGREPKFLRADLEALLAAAIKNKRRWPKRLGVDPLAEILERGDQ